jgi:hypothetical protein
LVVSGLVVSGLVVSGSVVSGSVVSTSVTAAVGVAGTEAVPLRDAAGAARIPGVKRLSRKVVRFSEQHLERFLARAGI